jgi:osmotically-inducible protein OsmY
MRNGFFILLLLFTANAYAQTDATTTVTPPPITKPLPGTTPAVSVLHTNDPAPQPPTPVPTDSTITANVQRKIASDDALKNQSIIVETHNGVVTLTGKAASQDQIDYAVKLAKSVSGIKDVVPMISIVK